MKTFIDVKEESALNEIKCTSFKALSSPVRSSVESYLENIAPFGMFFHGNQNKSNEIKKMKWGDEKGQSGFNAFGEN